MGLTELRIPLGLKTLLQILHKPLKFLLIQARYTFSLCFPTYHELLYPYADLALVCLANFFFICSFGSY